MINYIVQVDPMPLAVANIEQVKIARLLGVMFSGNS